MSNEIEAFQRFGQVFPASATMLIDTFDTVQGARNAIASGAPMRAVRLDSGDLAALSKEVRRILDGAGRRDVQIVASSDLNEYKIRDLLAAGAPIDVFGVGTELVTSRDDPSLNSVYKLVEQETSKGTVGRFKLSAEKKTYPFAKQVFRQHSPDGPFSGDLVARETESLPGAPLLEPVVRAGEVVEPRPTLEQCRTRCAEELRRLPAELLGLEPATPYPVRISDHLEAELRRLSAEREHSA